MEEQRIMSDYLSDGQGVRHIEKKNGNVWEGKYNQTLNKIEHDSVLYKSFTAFAVAHYKMARPERTATANGWIECESLCKITNVWTRLKKKKTLQEIIQNLKLKIADFEKREILCGLQQTYENQTYENQTYENQQDENQTYANQTHTYQGKKEKEIHYEIKDSYSVSEVAEMPNQQLLYVFKKLTGKESLPCSHCHLKTVELDRFVENIRKCCNNKKNLGLTASIQIAKTCDYAATISTKRNAYYRALKNTTDPIEIARIKSENKHLFEQPRRPKIIRIKKCS
jgi:hypothetical protein